VEDVWAQISKEITNENYIMSSFIIYILHLISLEGLYKEEWSGVRMGK
jgi:hypothetical protein